MSWRDDNQLVLDAIAGRHINQKGNVRANCPFCEFTVNKPDTKACLQVSMSSGYWKCWRCSVVGRLDSEDIPVDPSTLAHAKAQATEATRIDLPEGFIDMSGAEGKSFVLRSARAYLRERLGLGWRDMVRAAKIGACASGKFRGRIVVPIFKQGRLVGYVGRVWSNKPASRKYMYNEGFDRANTLYNEEALHVVTDEPVLVVEGVFDTFPFWPHAVAVLGKVSPPQLDMLLDAKRPILIAFDGDAHREGSSLAMSLRVFGKWAGSIKLPPGVDPDEFVEQVNKLKEKLREEYVSGRPRAEAS